jgi:cytochrome b
MTPRYTRTAKTLHWLMAVLILGLLALGFYMQDLPLSPQKLQLYSWHKWAGVTVFLLVLFRLAWRVTHQPPRIAGSPAEGPATRCSCRSCAAVSADDRDSAVRLVDEFGQGLSRPFWFGVLPIPDLGGQKSGAG